MMFGISRLNVQRFYTPPGLIWTPRIKAECRIICCEASFLLVKMNGKAEPDLIGATTIELANLAP